MYLSQDSKEDLNQSPGVLEEIFASFRPSEESFAPFDPAAIDEVLKESDFLDPFDEDYDNRLDFFALRLLGKINSPIPVYDDPSEAEYNNDYLDDDSLEQVPYLLRILNEDELDDFNGIFNEITNLSEEDSGEDTIIPGEEPEELSEPEEDFDEEFELRRAA